MIGEVPPVEGAAAASVAPVWPVLVGPLLVSVVQHAEKQSGAGDPGLTPIGRRQADLVARFLAEGPPVTRMVCSPLRRTLQTAQPIAARLALAATVEERLRERMNWDGSMPVAQFLAEWDAATADRSFSPTVGDSSHQAGARFAAVLTDLADQAAPGDHVVVVTHGGVTIDGLRTLFGDDAVQAAWPTWRHGIPSAAITRIGVDAPGPRLIAVADAGHLHDLGGGHH